MVSVFFYMWLTALVLLAGAGFYPKNALERLSSDFIDKYVYSHQNTFKYFCKTLEYF